MTYFRISTILALIASIAFGTTTLYRYILITSFNNGHLISISSINKAGQFADNTSVIFGFVVANYFLSLLIAQSKGRKQA